MDIQSGDKQIFRQSVFVLIEQLLVWEFCIIVFTKSIFYIASYFNLFQESFDNIFFGNSAFYWFLRVIELIVIVYITLRWAAKRYEITKNQVMIYDGIILEKQYMYLIDHIESVKLKRGIVGSIFRYGTIRMYAPTLKENIYLRNIPNPALLCDALSQCIARKDKKINITSQDS